MVWGRWGADLDIGQYEFVKRGDPPVMGITKLETPTTAAELRKPRRKTLAEETTHRLPGTVSTE